MNKIGIAFTGKDYDLMLHSTHIFLPFIFFLNRFNFIAKKLRKRLIQLGGTEIVSAGFADDQHDLGLVACLTVSGVIDN